MEEDDTKKQKQRKDKQKKPNVEAGPVLSQHTNVFSQLSANYLQTKTNKSQQEEAFVQNTEIIEYHDREINRMVKLLRKKAEVTKLKAAKEMTEYVRTMNADQVASLVPTFGFLMRQLILNDDCKQVIDEMCQIVMYFLEEHKKAVIANIAILFPSMLVAQKISLVKFYPLLFSGDPEVYGDKAVTLLTKPEVSKQFLVLSSIIIDSEDQKKLATPVFIRNCHALLKAFKDIMKAHNTMKEPQKVEEGWLNLLNRFSQLIQSQGAKQYINQETRAKAAFLEIFIEFLQAPVKVDSQFMISTITDSYLSKDPTIQSTLWKHCNSPIITICQKQNQLKIFDKYDTKLFEVLKIGGVSMLKELPRYVKLLPCTSINQKDTNGIMATINFRRKFNQALLAIEQQHQILLQSFADINIYWNREYQEFKQPNTQDEKQKKRRDELKKLMEKAERESASILEEAYYKSPPVSRNSMTYYIPQQFERVVSSMSMLPNFKINLPHSYSLYKNLATKEKFKPIVDEMFSGCKQPKQLLQYFQNFPARPVQISMKGGQLRDIYNRCRIMHLTLQYQQVKWFQWDFHHNFFMFDPLLQPHHLQEIEDKQKPNFNKKLFDVKKQDRYNQQRIQFLIKMMKQRDPKLRYFVPSAIQLILRESNFNWQPFTEILQQEMKQMRQSNMNSAKNLQCLLNIWLGVATEQKTETKQFSQLYFEYVFLLDEFKLHDQSSQFINRAWTLKTASYFPQLLGSARQCICNRIKAIVELGGTTQKQKNIRYKMQIATNLIRKCLQFFIMSREKQSITQIGEQILHPEYLKYALFRQEIWLFLKEILQQLAQDSNSLIKSQISQRNLVSVRLFVCLPSLYPLQTNLQLKRYFIQYCTSVIKPMILDELDNQNNFIYEMLISLAEESVNQSLIFSTGLRSIVKQTLLECGQQENLVRIYQECVGYLIKMLQQDNDRVMRASITLKNIIPQFGKLLQGQKYQWVVEQALKNVNDLLSKDENRIRFNAYLDLLSVYWTQGIATQLIFALPLDNIINKIMENINYQPINLNYEAQVLLTFANIIVEKKTLEPFGDHLVRLENIITKLVDYNYKTKQAETKYSSEALVRLCQFLRKIIPTLEAFRPEFKPLLMQNTLDLCSVKMEEYTFAAEDLHQGVIDDNIEAVLLEFSELISRFSMIVEPTLQETLVLDLINCVYPQIQKSAFILIRQFYELGYAKGDVPESMMKKLNQNVDQEATATVFSQLLMWSAYFIRKLSVQNEEEEENDAQNRQLADKYLSLVFSTMEHLQFDENGKDVVFEPQEVWVVSADWSNFLNRNELIKLCVQSLFIFSASFPMTLRNWVADQKDRRLKALCQSIIKNLISQALFLKEVEKIELRQGEWKSADFDIYAMKRSREITAEYKKESTSVALKLRVKPDYPLSTIQIDFANELKISQQLNKWAVKLRSILYSQNSSIVNAILLWKQNIDKEFEGVEECAICYDIVNAAKQLPRMVCKTCKKKFHSACIRKWFTTSNKSECPLCKSQFL